MGPVEILESENDRSGPGEASEDIAHCREDAATGIFCIRSERLPAGRWAGLRGDEIAEQRPDLYASLM